MINQFRAWDGQRMRYDVEEGTPFNDSEGAFPQTIIEITGKNYGWKWMQGIGLQDKNGRDIYECDIYRYGDEVGIFEDIKDFYYSELIRYRVEEGEIIGNRFENPELLELIDNS